MSFKKKGEKCKQNKAYIYVKMDLIIGILIPLFGTSIGASMVFLMKRNINIKIEKLLLGFASGVMLAASIWSLIMPSIEMAKEQGIYEWIPSSVGFILGVLFIFSINKQLNSIQKKSQKYKLKSNSFLRVLIMVISITLHNIPEGMAVGVIYALALNSNSNVTIYSALIFSIGIAIQNIPEGAIISMPLKNEGISKIKAFMYGIFSGVVEPICALITIILTSSVIKILPYLLAFAAGAMINVVIEDLIPESQEGENKGFGTLGVTLGFLLMMVLDIAL